VGITNFLDAPNRTLAFQSINDGLDRCVRRAFLAGKAFLNLSH
jgi:hypothetical protein